MNVRIDQAESSRRIAQDIDVLSGPEYTMSSEAICRYAYTSAYRKTLDYFGEEFGRLGFKVSEDCVGNFCARNRAAGEPVFGLGSHCDSNRNGGKYDGTLGVVAALEVCRLNQEQDLGLPIQVLSFLEEEGSGFGQTLLGSRICAMRIREEELKGLRAIDDGRTFWRHAKEAGYEPDRWRKSRSILEDLFGWIELHIEQGRVLQDTEARIGVVTRILGFVQGDVIVEGRADHAGATPMQYRADALAEAARCVVELERIVSAVGNDTVGTVGEMDVEPGILNVVPGKVRFSLDIRATDEASIQRVEREIMEFMNRRVGERGMHHQYSRRQRTEPVALDQRVVGALERAAKSSEASYMRLPSGGGHDTMYIAPLVSSGMVFVPCKDGISHSPLEEANAEDAALACEIIINAIKSLTSSPN